MPLQLNSKITIDELSKITNENRSDLLIRIFQNELKTVNNKNEELLVKYEDGLQLKHMLVGNYPLQLSDILTLSSFLDKKNIENQCVYFLTNRLIEPYIAAGISSNYEIGLFIDDYFINTWLSILSLHFKSDNYKLESYFSTHAFHMLQSDAGKVYQLNDQDQIDYFDRLLVQFESIKYNDKPFDYMVELIKLCLFEIPKKSIYNSIKYTIGNIIQLFKEVICDMYKINDIISFKKSCDLLIVQLFKVHLPIQAHEKLKQTNTLLTTNKVKISNIQTNNLLKSHVRELYENVYYIEICKDVLLIDEYDGYYVDMYLKEYNQFGSNIKYVSIKIPSEVGLLFIKSEHITESEFDMYFEAILPYINLDNNTKKKESI